MRPRLLLSLLLIAVTVAVYYPVRTFEFVNFDDPQYVTENRHVITGLTAENAGWAMTTSHAANWFPLTWMSLMLDASIWGSDAGGYHVTNMVLHVANVVLLFLLLAEITGRLGPSAFVAALFAIHPLHVESVAWVTERKDVLSTFFGLLAIWAYCRYAAGGRRSAYITSLGCFAASLMSKQMLVTLPLLLLLLDYWPLRRTGTRVDGGPATPVRRFVSEKLPFFAMAFAAALIVVMVQRGGGAVQSLAQVPLSSRVFNAVVVYVLYLGQTFWPVDLAAFYPFPKEGIPAVQVAVAALILCGINTLAIARARRQPYLLVGWLWYVLTLAPVIGIVQVGSQRMADRYTYVPLIGIFIAIAWLAAELVPAGTLRRTALSGLSLVIVGALSVVAAAQARYWSDSVTLFEHTLKVTTDNSAAHTNLGHALQSLGRRNEAVEQFEAALQIDPNHAIAHNNLGIELLAQGDKAAAQDHFTTAARIDLRYTAARVNLANVLRDSGETQEAIDEYRKALDVDPDDLSALINLSEVLRGTGHLDEAIRLMEHACAVDRNNASAQMNLGLAYQAARRVDDAIYHFKRAVALNDNSSTAHANLGGALKERGDRDEAAAQFRRALEIDPNQAETKANLSDTLLETGALAASSSANGVSRAIECFREAVALTPDGWEAHFNLALALQMQGASDEAEQHFRATLKLKPDLAAAHNALGAIILRRGASADAIDHFREALRLQPEFPAAQKNLNDALDGANQKK